MSSHSSFAALRRANPRNDPEFESDVCASAALEKRIMATDPASPASRWLWPRTPRRRLTLIAVTGAIVLLGGATAYAELGFPGPVPRIPDNASESDILAKGFLNWKQYSAEYDTWTHKIALPPGAKWRGCDPAGSKPSPDGTTVGYYLGAGASDAVEEGMGHWAIEWGAAVKAGDETRVAQAEAWVVHLRGLLRTGGDSVDHPGDLMRDNLGPGEARILDAAIAEAKQGHFGKLSRIVFGSTIPWSAYKEPSEPHAFSAHHAGWAETLNGPTHTGLDETAMAALVSATAADTSEEYRSYVLPDIGLPPGATLGAGAGRESEHLVGDGFVYAFNHARTAWWREWVAAGAAGDQKRVAAASEASARLLKLLPLRSAVDPFVLMQTLDAASMREFELLDAQARRGDLQGIRDWLKQQDGAR